MRTSSFSKTSSATKPKSGKAPCLPSSASSSKLPSPSNSTWPRSQREWDLRVKTYETLLKRLSSQQELLVSMLLSGDLSRAQTDLLYASILVPTRALLSEMSRKAITRLQQRVRQRRYKKTKKGKTTDHRYDVSVKG